MGAQRLSKKSSSLKHKVGRPSKYNQSILDAVDEYLEKVATKENMHLPKIESFAIYIGVERKTLYNWAKKNKEFAISLDKILTFQVERLIDDGIYGGKEVNATIIKLVLSNNHGYRDKTDITTDDEPINPYSDEQINRIAKRLIARRNRGTDKSSGKK